MPLQRLATSSGAGSRAALLSLQGVAGNRAVQRIVGEATLEEEQAPASDLFNVPDAHLPAPGGGQPIPDQVRHGMEGAFGQDFSDVRVHTDSSPDSVGALAYTQGHDVHFRPGMYQPESQSGREALGHELAHVVQQRAGRVATPQGMGAPVNADPSLEAEADALGKQAARAMDSGAALAAPAPAAAAIDEDTMPAQRIAAPVQRLGRGRSASLAALEDRRLVSGQRSMFEGGGGAAAAAATSSPAAMEGGSQAVADAVPATDEDTGAPEGAAEAVDALGSQAAPMAAALEEMAASVGPDNVIDTLQAEAEGADTDSGAAQADASSLTSVPSSAPAIAEALSLPPPQAAMPALAAAAEADGSPQVEEWSDWDDAAIVGRGRGGTVFEAPSAAPLPSASPGAARLGEPEVADDDDLSDWDDADEMVSQSALPADGGPGGYFRERSGAINARGGDSNIETSGTGMTVGGVLGTATQTSAEKSRDWLGAAAGATSQTAMIAQGAGGILGGGAALVDAGLSASRAHVSSGAAMAEEGARASSSLTGGAASVSNAAVGIEAARTGSSGLATGANAVMTAAGTAAAGLSVATGSIDVVRGVGGAVMAHSRATQLEEMAQAAGGSSTDLGMAARGAAETQRQRTTEGAVTATKGALSVAGGAILLALGLTNPVGLGLLAGAALVGGAYALYKLWKNKRSKNKDIGGGEKTQGEAKAELAATLFSRGIQGGESDYQAILVNLGFDATKVRRGVAGGITQAHILQRLG